MARAMNKLLDLHLSFSVLPKSPSSLPPPRCAGSGLQQPGFFFTCLPHPSRTPPQDFGVLHILLLALFAPFCAFEKSPSFTFVSCHLFCWVPALLPHCFCCATPHTCHCAARACRTAACTLKHITCLGGRG